MITYGGTPLPYLLIRLLFKFVLKVFYSSIVIENPEYIPQDGVPCILCANHSNSLTDALMLITAVPLSKRRWLRMTAKSTLFGTKTFSSWLIESVGTLPIQRAKDLQKGETGKKIDNSAVFEKLMVALEGGDMVCLFPEGISHYSPNIAPLRSGVARITSDVLSRNRDNPDFELTLLTCSITYLHRESFRSDVLVSFNQPIKINIREHQELFADPGSPGRSSSLGQLDGIKQLTGLMQEQIRQGTIDAPNFGVVRVANTARRIYAPLGTNMTLGDTVHITQRFVDLFARQSVSKPLSPAEALFTPLPPLTSSLERPPAKGPSSDDGHAGQDRGYFDARSEQSNGRAGYMTDEDIKKLENDLHSYQDILRHLGLKDDRIRTAPARQKVLIKRLFVRLAGAAALLAIATPGLVLWLPVFATASFFGWRTGSSGRIEDVWDEVAHTKLIYGLLSGVFVWLVATAVTFPIAYLSFFLIPVWMWVTLRWMEDALSSLRAAIALLSILAVGKKRMKELRAMRTELQQRVMHAAIQRAELPSDPEVVFDRYSGNREGRALERGGKVGRLGYFSMRRRRKKDYNEIMRLWDSSEYPK